MKKNSISKFFRLAVCIFLFANFFVEDGKGQMVYIPDTNFRNALIAQGFGVCITGDSIDSSCPLVANDSDLEVGGLYIHDLQGLQAFSSLKYLKCSHDSLTNLPTLPPLLITLDCSFNQLTTLPSLPGSLLILSCSFNQLPNIPLLPAALSDLFCNFNQLTNLPVLPALLSRLDCGENSLTSLPALPTSIIYLRCSNNHLTSLPNLPSSLIFLDCANNQIYGLSYPLPQLHSLNCSFNQLSSFPPFLPNSLVELYCGYNQLNNITSVPNSLLYFSCEDNQLTNLPPLPTSLKVLYCSRNQSSFYLPSVLPASLEGLTCTNNHLANLPLLPTGLTWLACDSNNLNSLPALPATLTHLDCKANNLSSLPTLPISLSYLYCEDNILTLIPELPPYLYYFSCFNNPSLNCLPQLKKIDNFRFYNTSINCLPNYGNVLNSYPQLSSIPLCGLFNSNGCQVFWNISGKSYFDKNLNCLFDSTDVRQQNMHIMLYDNGNLIQQTFTGGEGYYSFDVNDSAGNYTFILDTSNIPFNVLCPVGNIYNDTITATDTLFYNNDFALTCKPGFDLGAWSIVGYPFRPGHITNVSINAGDIANFYGAHCATGVSGPMMCILNGPVNYISPALGALTPDSISGDTIIYNIADFGAVNLFTAFNMVVKTDTNALNGSQVCITVSVTPANGDNNPANNILTHCFTVQASYDPNEKEVDPASAIDVSGNTWLTYTIHFQNTGSATAEHIYITDTLDSNLDLSTFQLLAYSHQPLVQILDGGIARFNFPNINLPDSNSNEPASHGYVQYKIKLKNTANAGIQIKNTAYIYFDFNSPVATNAVVTNVTNILGINQAQPIKNEIKIYPNPTSGDFTISFSGHVSEKVLVKIFNLLGDRIFEKNFPASSSLTINHPEARVQRGVYIVEILTGNITERKKLVIE